MWLSLRLRSIKGIGLRWLNIFILSDISEDFHFLWFHVERISNYINSKNYDKFPTKYSEKK